MNSKTEDSARTHDDSVPPPFAMLSTSEDWREQCPAEAHSDRKKLQAHRALIEGAIGENAVADDMATPSEAAFGDYILEKELGRGAFGVVYLARHAGIRHEVALKQMLDGELATDSQVRHFLQGAEAAAVLDHANIVPIFHVSARSEMPFFTMRYINGGNLARAISQQKPSVAQALDWIVQIARAVQHAHDRGLIHLDLKPANVLLDESSVPYVTDFGLARRLDPKGEVAQSGVRGGTPYYMAREQISREPTGLTIRTDVYALGVILHELLTGKVPYWHLTPDRWAAALRSAEPVPTPRQLDANVDRDLDKICSLALAKDPRDRYQSAGAFADDVEHVALEERDLLSWRRSSPRTRISRWVRSHRLTLSALLWALLLISIFVFRVRTGDRLQREGLANQAREDASMASVQAVAFEFQLLEYQHRIARLAQLPEVIALAASSIVENPSRLLIERSRGFDLVFVLGPDGRARARTTRKSDEYLQRSFAFRDYFRGARELALVDCDASGTRTTEVERRAYVSRAHISESDDQFEFVVAAPICDTRGWAGIIGGSISSNRVFGAVRLTDGHPGRIAALLGPRDSERKDIGRPLPAGFTFIVHPGLAPGREYQLQRPDPAQIRSAFGITAAAGELRYVAPYQTADYVDPIPMPGSAGPWSAAFAPVGSTGFVVVVQSPRLPIESLAGVCGDVALELTAPFGISGILLLFLGARRKVAPSRRSLG